MGEDKRVGRRKSNESSEMYLETLLVLQEAKDGVHAKDIADEMGFSKPTVSEYLKKLREVGLVTVDGDGHVQFTDEGKGIATRVYERHRVLTAALKALGVSPEVAREDACRVEHYISDETFECIKRHMATYAS